MANFFIRRPIVAIVIAILTVMLGLVTISGLSVEQYPFLAPPNIRVTATYPGASAEAVEQSVATPIEQEVNGVDRLIYMKSSNTSDGRMLLDVNFEVGTDQDMANVLTQNRVSAAQARLPVEVTQQGVTVKKQSPSILMLISLYSPHGLLRRQLPDQLCRHQPARPVAAHSGHRAGGPVRRHRLRHAHLVPARPARQAGPDPGRRDQRDQGAEPAGAHRQGRRRADAEGPAVHQHGQRPGPPGHARRSSRTSSCGRATPARWSASRTSAAPNSARRTTTPSGG